MTRRKDRFSFVNHLFLIMFFYDCCSNNTLRRDHFCLNSFFGYCCDRLLLFRLYGGFGGNVFLLRFLLFDRFSNSLYFGDRRFFLLYHRADKPPPDDG